MGGYLLINPSTAEERKQNRGPWTRHNGISNNDSLFLPAVSSNTSTWTCHRHRQVISSHPSPNAPKGLSGRLALCDGVANVDQSCTGVPRIPERYSEFETPSFSVWNPEY